MPSRRKYLAIGASVAVAAAAGCLDVVTGDEPLEFHSSRAAPTDEALAETEFEEQQVSQEEIEEVIDLGVEREIHATFWVSAYTYDASFELGSGGGQVESASVEAAAFTAISVPGMEVLGSQQNPLADMDAGEIIDEFGDQFEGEGELRDVRRDRSYDLEILGETRTVDVFAATAERDGQEFDVVLEMSNFQHEDDILVLVGVYPEAVADDDPPIDDLMASVRHPLE